MLASANPLEHVIQHPLVTVPFDAGVLTPKGELTLLSDQLVMMIVAALLLVMFLPPLVRKRRGTGEIDRLIPTGFANFMEVVCDYLRKNVAEPALQQHTDRFIKYIWSVFFFVLTMNLLGLLPIPGLSMWLFDLHVGGTATGNIWVTGSLATCTMVMMVVNGLRLGGMHYIAHFCPGPLWMAPVLVPVEILGLVAKIFALTVRLFANMMAGHILLAVLAGFILAAGTAMGAVGGLLVAVPVVAGSVAITFLEIFVAFLQAFIFAFLTTLFIGMSVVFHHDEHEHEHGHGEAHAVEAH